MNHQKLGQQFIILLVALLVGCNKSASNRPEQPAFKGMELYSWQGEDDEWRFSLLIGTNRNKLLSEVQAEPLDIDTVKKSFCKMAIGESIFWGRFAWDLASEANFEFVCPPASRVNELKERASFCKIELVACNW